MDYLHLPPGRRRGIEYANYIETRTSRRRHLRVAPLPRRTPIRRRVHNFNAQTNFNIEGLSYERLSQLEDIKLGLINKNLLNNSRVTNNFDDDDFICVICQDNVEISDIVRILKCTHIYHIYCIDKWFTENKKCPTCKTEI